jgi:polyhydroxyalkanoate synthesis regulator protein
MLVPRYLEVSIESLTREQEKFRQQMAQAFGVGAFTSLEEQVRRRDVISQGRASEITSKFHSELISLKH